MKPEPLLLSALLLTFLSGRGFAKDADSVGPTSLEQAFASPPAPAKPFVHWYWQISATPEKITQDLEAMQAEGIQGARVYPYDLYMKPEWPPLFEHLLKEAERLGLQIHLNNDCSWSCKKLPWMTPEFAQKRIVHTATSVTGGGTVRANLPRPEINDPVFASYANKFTPKGQTPPRNHYYTDVVALAVRKTAGAKPLPKQRPENGLLWSIQPFDLMTAKDNYASFPPEAFDVLDDAQWLETGVPSQSPEDVVNLTSRMNADGTIHWDAPPGEWTILRFGCTVLSPWAPDFFRKDALDYHLQQSVEKLLPGVSTQVAKTWTHMQFDSWENGRQTWTPDFPSEFLGRRGYDLTPWLPVLAGIPIGSASLSSRFLHDYRRTIADLLVENHFAHWTKRLHEMGLKFTTQGAYGWASPIADSLRIFGAIDQPQAEIWNPQRHPLTGKLQSMQFQIHKIDRESPLGPRALPFGLGLNTIRLAASASHIYGKPACSAETFSSYYDIAGLQSYTETPETPAAYLLNDPPSSLKATADRAFSDGLQHVAYHVYGLQPADKEGAMRASKGYGLHFNRNMTWWKQSHAFTEYLARCSALLQRGTFVADFAYWTGDAVPYACPDRRAMRPALPLGCDSDVINSDVLTNHAQVRNGRLVLSSGMSYRYLVLPPTQTKVDPVSLRQIRDLIVAGATVLLGPKPVSAAGLSGHPHCDQAVRQLADELWGSVENPAPGIHSVGRGRVARGMGPAEILKADGLCEDVQISGSDGQSPFDWIHRRDGETDIYFVSNQSDQTRNVTATFRVSGAKPEWWDSVDGSRRALPEFSEKDGATTILLEFLPLQSAFVVFTRSAHAEALFKAKNFPVLQTAETFTGPWQVTFDTQRRGPGEVVFDSLQDWSKRPEEGIRYYAGTAIYRKTFDLPKGVQPNSGPLYLDLGAVKDLAEVKLNGKPLGVVWTAPWRVEISRGVKERENTLEIAVVNQWPNRLIGDARSPSVKPFLLLRPPLKQNPDQPLLPSGLLGPVTLKRVITPPPSPPEERAPKPTSLKTEFLVNPLMVDTAHPRFSWIVEDQAANAKQTSYQVQAASSPEKLAKGEADLWDSGKVESGQSHLVKYGGKPLVSRQRVWWRIKSWGNNGRETPWSDTASLEAGLLQPEDWSAQWIKAPDLAPVSNDGGRVWVQMTTLPVIPDNFLPGDANEPASPVPAQERAKAESTNIALLEKLAPCPLLRREVALQGAIRCGRAYVAAPGFFELRINGSKVGDKELEPGVTPFKEQVSYSVHDITPLLREGINAFGLILGHGWFDSGRIGHNVPVGTAPLARAQFEIEFEDGHRVVFGTDGEWKSAPGPIIKDSHWLGECYDARLERVGWDEGGFDDGAWKNCLVTSSPTKRLTPDLVPAERVVRRIKAARLYSPAEGVWVYDMGEAFSGTAELKVTVPVGTALTLRYAQRVFAPEQPIGSLLRYQDGVAGERTPGRIAPYPMAEGCAPSTTFGRRYHAHSPTDVYVASGRNEEVWRRRFSYTGYRYVELTGYPGKPPEDAVTGVVVHTDLPQEGTFKCSDERLNRVHAACLNTYRYCTHGFTQDNPTREKQYCPEMTAGCARLAATAFSVPMLWSKSVESSLLTQDVSGHFRQFCNFRPSLEQPLHEDGPIRLAYLLWLRYGDDRILRRGLDQFAAYLDYYWDNPQNRRDNGASKNFFAAKDLSEGYLRGGFFCFDWYDSETVLDLPRGQHPPRDRQRPLWGTGVLLENLKMLVSMAAHAGREDLVRKYSTLGEKAREEWNQTFFNPASGSYGCQGNNALALVADLPTPENVPRVVAALVADIEKLDGRFTTGTHGFPRLMDALSMCGREDLAYGMLSRETYPSLGHMLKTGNGTLFETWNTFTNPTGGSGSNVMQSERPRAGFWFAEWLGGIRPDSEHPGFQQFILGPVFPKELNSSHAEVVSPYGRITSAWEKRGDSVHWNVTVPWNTSASVKLPGFTQITVNGKPEEQSAFNLPAGEWEIVAMQNKERK